MDTLKSALIHFLGRTKFIERFQPGKRPLRDVARAFFHGVWIKALMHLGFGVVVVGRTASGKSYLLGKSLQGSVITPDIFRGQLQPLDLVTMPKGLFAIDEPQAFDWSQREKAFDALRSRRVLFTVQSLGILQELKLHELFEERLVVVFLGSKTEFKQQLNEYRLWGKQAAQQSQFRV